MIQFVSSKTGKLLLSWLGKVWAALSGHSQGLLDLTTLQVTNLIVDYHYAGLQTVSLHQIRGSASPCRCYDFDANFRLLQSRTKSRWEGISTARRRGAKLPPVSLIQVGETYFVEDGHHRVSVAKAWREQTVEAEVTVWQIAVPLPHIPLPLP